MKNIFFSVLSFCILTSSVNSQTIQWQQLNGSFGGTAISFASNSAGNVFAGADYAQNGVNRSADGGLTWSMSSNGIDLNARSVDAIFVTQNNNIIIGTRSSNGSRIYRSTDNGNYWYEVANNLGAKAFAANDFGEIFAVPTENGNFFKSIDDGLSWQEVTGTPIDYFRWDVAINGSGHIFICGSTIYRSTDDGISWTDVGSGYIITGAWVTSIAINDSGYIFVGTTQEYAANSGILKSTDNGETWISVLSGKRIGEHHNIAINSLGEVFVGSDGWGILRSTDNGISWLQYNNGIQHPYIRSMHISSNGVIYAGTVGGGIYRSDDWAENWVQVGFSAAIVQKIAVSPVNGNLFTAVSGVSRSTDLGQSWEPVNYGLADYETKTLAIKNDGVIFCGTQGSNQYILSTVFRSTNNGNSWVAADTGLTGSSKYALAIDQDGSIYVGDQDNVYKSTNNGNSWFSIGGPGAVAGIAFNSAGDLFATRDQVVWRKIYGDTNWVQFSIPCFCNQSLFISRNDYIYTNGWRSTDNGETWTQMTSLERDANAFCENSLGYLFAGHVLGVYLSTDNGENWTQVNDGLTYTNILSLGIDSDGFLYAGTNGRSIFKTTTSSVSSVESSQDFPTAFSLSQNYPNPFNPITTIQYSIPDRSNVVLKVYDILGNEVATLVNEEKYSGVYTITFDAGKLASGMYLYRIRAGSFIDTKKLIFLK